MSLSLWMYLKYAHILMLMLMLMHTYVYTHTVIYIYNTTFSNFQPWKILSSFCFGDGFFCCCRTHCNFFASRLQLVMLVSSFAFVHFHLPFHQIKWNDSNSNSVIPKSREIALIKLYVCVCCTNDKIYLNERDEEKLFIFGGHCTKEFFADDPY